MDFRLLLCDITLAFGEVLEGRRLVVFPSTKRTGNRIFDDVIVTINDDGPGFSASVLSRVGAPWNTSRRGKGANRGLGIFIASTLIESLGGSILYGNAKDGGGEVKIQLPRNSLVNASVPA